MFYSSSEDETADRYFGFVNNEVGGAALALSATALQFEKAAPFAAIFFLLIFVWAFSGGNNYRKTAKRYTARFKGFFGTLDLMWRLDIFLVGYSALYFIAVGKLTKVSICAAWPF